ncbi:DUF1800 domain-containing protein [Paenibacillus hexagrammi]|uniref:DUF1800 domain-containing protein n=1 Tax=Paenibacillus hexagrammi TaxID=2908839 RepID=A0ABY3SJW0_9BACL|nr:DUF1800 domain-containing protein [Paenibacillus sp. YPD9-1]UJF34334.1 DUF1800 domain-containing protein [Paenibacillus sp. YPD9-1]
MSQIWTEHEVIHLLNRASFGGTKLEIDACLKLGKLETVNRLITGQPLTDYPQSMKEMNDVICDGIALNSNQLGDQQLYWFYRMINTSAPLIEKMTLFWHSHFATSIGKVHLPPLMLRQNELFRRYALGSFRDLLNEIGTDPAMMMWLDVGQNRKGSPNENYAREVMELFTLGRGCYSEQDVKEAARSFTGWNYDRVNDLVDLDPAQHDSGMKTVLGKSGFLDADDIINILIGQDALYSFIANKLLQYFALPNPPQTWVAEVASQLKKSQNIGDTISTIFLSDKFYEEHVVMSLIKSPVEYIVTLSRLLPLPFNRYIINIAKAMGQELYNPPNVAGWQGDQAWLSTTYLFSRFQFVEWAVKYISISWLQPFSETEKMPTLDRIKFMGRQLSIPVLSPATLYGLTNFASTSRLHTKDEVCPFIHLMLMCPEAQLK